MTPPCTTCQIHLRGIDKSGPACMACEARVAYVAAIATGRTNVVLPPPPEAAATLVTDAPEAPARRSAGAYRRDRKQSSLRRYGSAQTVMAARRKALGLTQERLALKIGLSTQTICEIEGGRYRRKLRTGTLLDLAAALDIPAGMLFMPCPPDREIAP